MFVKFGAVRSGESAPALFEQLLDACEALAADAGINGRISLGIGEARGIQASTGKWVSKVLLISITFSLVKPPPAASSEIALR